MKTMETHPHSQQLLKTHKTRYVKLHNIEALAVLLLQTHPTAVSIKISSHAPFFTTPVKHSLPKCRLLARGGLLVE
jgi:hypothetical protein